MRRVVPVALALQLVLAGCAMTAGQSRPAAQPLPGGLAALDRPARAELHSMTVKSLLDGATSRIAIEPDGAGLRIRDAQGCTATRALDWFAPSWAYENCGTSRDWQSASGEVRVVESLYPLRVGSTGRYWRRLVSSSTGEVSTRETDCRVPEAVVVALPGGRETPAFVVTCDDGRITRTTWYAPGTGPVAYREEQAHQGVRDAWIRVE